MAGPEARPAAPGAKDDLPSVSIVVPCRNEATHIERFVECVLRQTWADFELIVADGASDDGTRELLDNFRARDYRLVVIDNPGRHVSTALNRAIVSARGDVVLRMDVHTEYAADYVAQCIHALQTSGADNVGGPARTRSESYVQKAICAAFHSPFSVGGARFHDIRYEGDVDTVTYGCWYRRKLEELGLFDEELVRNQDDELNLRLTKAGGRIWQTPKIRSWYYPRDSITALFRQYLQYGYWKVRVIQKHKLPASLRHLVPGFFVAVILILLVLAPLHPVARLLLGLVVASYSLAIAVASVLACHQARSWRCLPVMPVVFGAYHLGYGLGFIRGLIDFALLGRRSSRFSALTRRN